MISANKKSKQNIENETSQRCLQPQASFLFNRKDRLRRSLELRNARLEAGMANR